jgi:hypothetical protein
MHMHGNNAGELPTTVLVHVAEFLLSLQTRDRLAAVGSRPLLHHQTELNACSLKRPEDSSFYHLFCDQVAIRLVSCTMHLKPTYIKPLKRSKLIRSPIQSPVLSFDSIICIGTVR